MSKDTGSACQRISHGSTVVEATSAGESVHSVSHCWRHETVMPQHLGSARSLSIGMLSFPNGSLDAVETVKT